ncbi:unnamed protein product, partial [Prorocentrum cordatum]
DPEGSLARLGAPPSVVGVAASRRRSSAKVTREAAGVGNNGFGRIGRQVARVVMEDPETELKLANASAHTEYLNDLEDYLHEGVVGGEKRNFLWKIVLFALHCVLGALFVGMNDAWVSCDIDFLEHPGTLLATRYGEADDVQDMYANMSDNSVGIDCMPLNYTYFLPAGEDQSPWRGIPIKDKANPPGLKSLKIDSVGNGVVFSSPGVAGQSTHGGLRTECIDKTWINRVDKFTNTQDKHGKIDFITGYIIAEAAKVEDIISKQSGKDGRVFQVLAKDRAGSTSDSDRVDFVSREADEDPGAYYRRVWAQAQQAALTVWLNQRGWTRIEVLATPSTSNAGWLLRADPGETQPKNGNAKVPSWQITHEDANSDTSYVTVTRFVPDMDKTLKTSPGPVAKDISNGGGLAKELWQHIEFLAPNIEDTDEPPTNFSEHAKLCKKRFIDGAGVYAAAEVHRRQIFTYVGHDTVDGQRQRGQRFAWIPRMEDAIKEAAAHPPLHVGVRDGHCAVLFQKESSLRETLKRRPAKQSFVDAVKKAPRVGVERPAPRKRPAELYKWICNLCGWVGAERCMMRLSRRRADHLTKSRTIEERKKATAIRKYFTMPTISENIPADQRVWSCSLCTKGASSFPNAAWKAKALRKHWGDDHKDECTFQQFTYLNRSRKHKQVRDAVERKNKLHQSMLLRARRLLGKQTRSKAAVITTGKRRPQAGGSILYSCVKCHNMCFNTVFDWKGHLCKPWYGDASGWRRSDKRCVWHARPADERKDLIAAWRSTGVRQPSDQQWGSFLTFCAGERNQMSKKKPSTRLVPGGELVASDENLTGATSSKLDVNLLPQEAIKIRIGTINLASWWRHRDAALSAATELGVDILACQESRINEYQMASQIAECTKSGWHMLPGARFPGGDASVYTVHRNDTFFWLVNLRRRSTADMDATDDFKTWLLEQAAAVPACDTVVFAGDWNVEADSPFSVEFDTTLNFRFLVPPEATRWTGPRIEAIDYFAIRADWAPLASSVFCASHHISDHKLALLDMPMLVDKFLSTGDRQPYHWAKLRRYLRPDTFKNDEVKMAAWLDTAELFWNDNMGNYDRHTGMEEYGDMDSWWQAWSEASEACLQHMLVLNPPTTMPKGDWKHKCRVIEKPELGGGPASKTSCVEDRLRRFIQVARGLGLKWQRGLATEAGMLASGPGLTGARKQKLDQAHQRLQRELDVSRMERISAWKRRVKIDPGGSAVYKWIRGAQWRPTDAAVRIKDELFTGAGAAHAAREHYQQHYQACGNGNRINDFMHEFWEELDTFKSRIAARVQAESAWTEPTGVPDRLPLFGVNELRRALKPMRGKACGVDGWSADEALLLPDSALESLINCFAEIEEGARPPTDWFEVAPNPYPEGQRTRLPRGHAELHVALWDFESAFDRVDAMLTTDIFEYLGEMKVLGIKLTLHGKPSTEDEAPAVRILQQRCRRIRSLPFPWWQKRRLMPCAYARLLWVAERSPPGKIKIQKWQSYIDHAVLGGGAASGAACTSAFVVGRKDSLLAASARVSFAPQSLALLHDLIKNDLGSHAMAVLTGAVWSTAKYDKILNGAVAPRCHRQYFQYIPVRDNNYHYLHPSGGDGPLGTCLGICLGSCSAHAEHLAYQMKYDSIHGMYDGTVEVDGGSSVIDGHKVALSHTRDPTEIPFKEHGADYVRESTGVFLADEKIQPRLKAGAKKVVFSAPAKDGSHTIVMGVRQDAYKSDMDCVSGTSCTTNGLAPTVKAVNDAFGIKRGLMTTIHAMTAAQPTVDGASKKDWHGGRAASGNITPSSTGAAMAVARVVPEVAGKLAGMAVRVPTIDAAVVDLPCELGKAMTYEELCAEIKRRSEGDMKGFLGYCDVALVSTDFETCPVSSAFDFKAGIMLDRTFVKLVAWYDNEWGYSCRVVDLIKPQWHRRPSTKPLVRARFVRVVWEWFSALLALGYGMAQP